MMAEGAVKWFDEKKGFGFISTEEHGDVFVRYTGIDGSGFRTLQESARVSFEITDSPKGPQAVNVKAL